ncbi:FAD-binding protein, partial [candidate division WOR-3 bacterium]|nr:FAD-binding protein [candidate division WOR-3 bacterium]
MEIISDYLVVGSGIAGLIFAIKASRYGKVIIITKKTQSETNTNYAQGGIATVFSADDSFKSHIDDTLIAGCGLSHKNVVDMVIENGPRVVEELLNLGVNFSENNGQLDLGREGG